jgi:diguanylate cyclase (GGDEF)-like protein/PAS domain S-box-containing protein
VNEQLEDRVAERTAALSAEITARKQSEESLRVSEVRYRTLAETAPDMIFIVDRQERLQYANASVARQLQTSTEAISGKLLTQLFPPETAARQVAAARHVFDTGESAQDDFVIRFPNQELWFSTRLTPMFAPSGQVDAVMGIARDITQHKQAEELLREKAVLSAELAERERSQIELRARSLQDELTGLYNRRGFMTLAGQHYRLALRTEQEFALLYVDLDDLKVINDTFGHAQGDLAIRAVARALEQTFRESDILARIGGDEFVVLFTDHDLPSVKAPIARLQENLKQTNANAAGLSKLSVSVGVAYFDPRHPVQIDDLLAQADGDMYAHKQERKKSAE